LSIYGLTSRHIPLPLLIIVLLMDEEATVEIGIRVSTAFIVPPTIEPRWCCVPDTAVGGHWQLPVMVAGGAAVRVVVEREEATCNGDH
jgi:hypothetical protein